MSRGRRMLELLNMQIGGPILPDNMNNNDDEISPATQINLQTLQDESSKEPEDIIHLIELQLLDEVCTIPDTTFTSEINTSDHHEVTEQLEAAEFEVSKPFHRTSRSISQSSCSSRSSSGSSSSTSTSSSTSSTSITSSSCSSASNPDPNYIPSASSSSSESTDDGITEATNDAPQENNLRRLVKHPHPPPEKLVRKRKRNTQLWQRNIRKTLRNKGAEYTSFKYFMKADGSKERMMVKKDGKKMQPPCNPEKCRIKCSTKFSEEQRETLFNKYWKMGDINSQRMYIASCITLVKPAYRYLTATTKLRGLNNAYYFYSGENKIRVCKVFFMSTLAINSRVIRTVLAKQKAVPGIVEVDNRGKHGNQFRISEDMKEEVRSHINSIPRIESHFCRAQTKKEYIEGSKSMADLHRDYVQLCDTSNKPHVNYAMYVSIFKEEFNISFYSPKKDQCDFCMSYNNANEEQRSELKNLYDVHIQEKTLSRLEKQKDKDSPEKLVAVFDLQAALPCPLDDSSSFYYVSKLNVYNLTVYELKTTKAFCFTWHEGLANRGANEIGSCIWNYLANLNAKASTKIDVVLFSDNCAGQNKNRFIFSLYIHAVSFFENINSISHKFLVCGHTQNEGDHIHSLIEREIRKFKKGSPIYVPDNYITIFKQAKKQGSFFEVREMGFNDFFDIKELSRDLGVPAAFKDEQGNSVNITKICSLKIVKDEPDLIYFKTSFTQEDYQKIKLKSDLKRSRPQSKINVALKQAYKKKVGIAPKKKESLKSLFQKKKNGVSVMPQYYKDFYYNL